MRGIFSQKWRREPKLCWYYIIPDTLRFMNHIYYSMALFPVLSEIWHLSKKKSKILWFFTFFWPVGGIEVLLWFKKPINYCWKYIFSWWRCRTRVIVVLPGGGCESSTSSDCHKNQINKDFGLIIFGLDQVFVQDKTKIMLGLNVKSYFWPIRLSLPTVLQLPLMTLDVKLI